MQKFTTIEMDCLLSAPSRGCLLSFRRFKFDVIRFMGARGGMDSGLLAQARPE
ncbi:hypothetical protein FORC54_3522 [Vibrio vulnificus]|nr:hypothetical protein FORC54_3522 [Vibrio vulnificus]